MKKTVISSCKKNYLLCLAVKLKFLKRIPTPFKKIMEIGAVKQAFNNEVLVLKKKLNQAKIQVIHKLTRKAKTLSEKKCPEKLKEKITRKAQGAIEEVKIIKKLKAKDVARFALSHKGKLSDYLNKPTVDQEKACARLLLHKCMEDKYDFFRRRFINMPLEKLLMSRDESRKLKKEARENKKKKGKGSKVKNESSEKKINDNVVVDERENNESDSEIDSESDEKKNGSTDVDELMDSEGGSDIDNEPINYKNISKHHQESRDNESDVIETDCESNNDEVNSNISDKDNLASNDELCYSSDIKNIEKDIYSDDNKSTNEHDSDCDNDEEIGKFVRKPKIEVKNVQKMCQVSNKKTKSEQKASKKSKPKNTNKGKNLNEKILQRKFKKTEDTQNVEQRKVVDPFFITATGENYMSVSEPRPPDEFKEAHRQGNRKLRRAIMFGYEPKIKARRDNFVPNKKFERNNDFPNGKPGFNDRANYRSKVNENRVPKNKVEEPKLEKLHPSWEAKKKLSSIVPFQGKKIVFDDS